MNAVVEYFNGKADLYDETDKQLYWKFSDELLWFLLKTSFLPEEPQACFSLLDAGGGTGRWTKRILSEFHLANASVVDLSDGMLDVAKKKFQNHGLSQRTKIYQDDLCSLQALLEPYFDLAICFHNVIGFVADPALALKKITERLEKRGKLALMAPSLYHALYFCNANGRMSELERIRKERRVCYNDQMPPLRVFEIEEIEGILNKLGFGSVASYGFPVTFYPGMDETFLEGQTDRIAEILEQSGRSLFEVEKELCQNPKIAPRGNNLLFIAKKHH